MPALHFISATQAFQAVGSRNLIGILLSLISAVTYAGSVLLTKRLLVGVPGGLVALTQQVVATVILLPAVFLTARGRPWAGPPSPRASPCPGRAS